MSIRVTIPISKLATATSKQIHDFLRLEGLDTSQEYGAFKDGPNITYVGEALPAPHSGFMKTCVGMVPIRKPWLGAVA